MTTAYTRQIFELLARAAKAVERGQLSAPGFLLLYVLTQYANEEKGGEAWPSQKTLRDRLNLKSTRGVQKMLDRLEALGLITVESGQGKHVVSTYRLVLYKVNGGSPFHADKVNLESSKGEPGRRDKVNHGSHGTTIGTTSELPGSQASLGEPELPKPLHSKPEHVKTNGPGMEKHTSATSGNGHAPSSQDSARFVAENLALCETSWTKCPSRKEAKRILRSLDVLDSPVAGSDNVRRITALRAKIAEWTAGHRVAPKPPATLQ